MTIKFRTEKVLVTDYKSCPRDVKDRIKNDLFIHDKYIVLNLNLDIFLLLNLNCQIY